MRAVLGLFSLLLSTMLMRGVEAQPGGAPRARRAARVIHLEESECEMARWHEPLLVPVLARSECPVGDLVASCGATPASGCPAIDEPAVLAAIVACAPSREVLLALTRAVEPGRLAPGYVSLLDRISTRTQADEIDRLLVADLLLRTPRYEASLSRFVALADEAHDPAIRALALERIIEIIEHEDWNEDGAVDPDFATHFEPPRLPERPWAREVAHRALSRVGCSVPHATALEAIRRRFGEVTEREAAPSSGLDAARPEQGAFDHHLIHRRLLVQPLAACPRPAAAALVLVTVDEAGHVLVTTSATDPCVRATLAAMPDFDIGAEGGVAWQQGLLVFPRPEPPPAPNEAG